MGNNAYVAKLVQGNIAIFGDDALLSHMRET
jgi:hypothetical protein